MTESSWVDTLVARTDPALRGLADPERAQAMAAYMKHVAPFLGVAAPERRRAQRDAWAGLPRPSAAELAAAARALSARPERELHYAAIDLIARHRAVVGPGFLEDPVEALLTTTPWWDTVDGLVSAAVSPLCRRFGLEAVIDRWTASGDRWLVRASLGHQRGWGEHTDTRRVLSLCDRHHASREFFVAKAIGWALRDLSRNEPGAVRAFLDAHPDLGGVARREAERGIARVGVG